VKPPKNASSLFKKPTKRQSSTLFLKSPDSCNHRKSCSLFALTLYFILTTLSGAQGSLTRGPYLQKANPSEITIRWRTSSNSDSLVQYGTAAGNLTQSTGDGSSVTDHEVRLTGLAANTTYYYSVGSSSATLASGTDYFFVSAPIDAKPTRIWVIGDAGTANSNAASVRDSYKNYTGARYTDLWLMLGDNAYEDGTDSQYQNAVFNMYPTLLKQSVLWPTIGNHDGHTASSSSQSGPYYDIFSLPTLGESGGISTGTEAYYSVDYGNIHLICLNSWDVDRSSAGPMLTWLQSDLVNNVKDWIIAFWHHPPYSRGSHNSDATGRTTDMRQNALPILEDNGVDLVMSGHTTV
jgi:hypothetical protein